MDNSPLGGLPPELRNRIAELVLVEDKPIEVFQYYSNRKPTGPRTVLKYAPDEETEHDEGLSHFLALIQTCRQLRSEMLKLFYGANSINVQLFPASSIGHAERYSRDIPGCLATLTDFLGLLKSCDITQVRTLTMQNPWHEYDKHSITRSDATPVLNFMRAAIRTALASELRSPVFYRILCFPDGLGHVLIDAHDFEVSLYSSAQ